MSVNREHRTIIDLTKDQVREMFTAYLAAKFNFAVPHGARLGITWDGEGRLRLAITGAQTIVGADAPTQ